jgi:hypothetical protein
VTAGHLDLIYNEPTTRMRGLEVLIKSEKGAHLRLDIVRVEKVRRKVQVASCISGHS